MDRTAALAHRRRNRIRREEERRLRAVVSPLQAIEREWWEADHAQRVRYDLECRRYKRLADQWACTGSGPQPEEPARPPRRRLCIEDATTEAAAEVLEENPRGIGAVYDELSAWLGSFDAYRNRGGKDRAFWLRSADGGPMLVDRVRGRTAVDNCSISILGSIQPGPFRRLAGKIADDGLPQRFIPIFPMPGGRGVDRVPSQTAGIRYAALLRHLVELPPPHGPYRLALEAQAERLAVTTVAEHVAILPTTADAFRSHLKKWDGIYARLALLWHLAGQSSSRREARALSCAP